MGLFVNSICGFEKFGYLYIFVFIDFNIVVLDVKMFGIKVNDDKVKFKVLGEIVYVCVDVMIIYCKLLIVVGLVVCELIRFGYGILIENFYVDWVSEEFDVDWDYIVVFRNGIGLYFGVLLRVL